MADVVLINCYPFWERVPADYALLAMKEMYRRAERVADGKQVIIGCVINPDTQDVNRVHRRPRP